MGNETSGFAVLNLSGYTMHIGLSMAALHYYENDVEHGEIFYRRPGAVYYSVLAQTSPKLSDERRVKEITKASLLGVTCAGAAVAGAVISLPGLPALSVSVSSLAATATVGASNAATVKNVLDVLVRVPAADLNVKKIGCYGGRSGTWLVLRGGLQPVNGGGVKHEKLCLEKVEPEFVLENGEFTAYSYEKFYERENTRNFKAAGHSCETAMCNLLS